MKSFVLLICFLSILSCNNEQENGHTEPTHNFTVDRLIIVNDKNEIFMGREENVWGAPSFPFNKRQFVNESIDSLANAYGITISEPELRGYFGFKYEYHPFATRRAFYVAKYKGGTPKLAEPAEEIKWMTLDEVVENSIVDAWKGIFKNIIEHPRTVWGGSFEVYREGEDHRTRTIEEFYPLFALDTISH